MTKMAFMLVYGIISLTILFPKTIIVYSSMTLG